MSETEKNIITSIFLILITASGIWAYFLGQGGLVFLCILAFISVLFVRCIPEMWY